MKNEKYINNLFVFYRVKRSSKFKSFYNFKIVNLFLTFESEISGLTSDSLHMKCQIKALFT